MHSKRTLWFVAGMVALAAATALAQSDDPFLHSLAKDQPVDRPGLARFLVGISSSLQAGRDAVAYMKLVTEDTVRGEQFRTQASEAMQQRLEAYDDALAGLRTASRRLLEEPGSESRLFAALIAGQHSCWRLESPFCPKTQPTDISIRRVRHKSIYAAARW